MAPASGSFAEDEPLDLLEADDVLDLRARDERLRTPIGRRSVQSEPSSRYGSELALRIDGFDHPEDGIVTTRFSLEVPEEFEDALGALSGWGISEHPDATLGELIDLAMADDACPVRSAAKILTSWTPRSSVAVDEAATIEILRRIAHLLRPDSTELLAVFEWAEDGPDRTRISSALGIPEQDLSRRLADARSHMVEKARIPAAWPVRTLADRMADEIGGHPVDPISQIRTILRDRFDETPPIECIGLLATGFCGFVRDEHGWWRQRP
jgi:hypothetical protein